MTETRKQIIELIEPYMDKTLSEGCLIVTPMIETVGLVINNSKYNLYALDRNPRTKRVMTNSGKVLPISEIREILGHYDITALEKFFLHKMPSIKFQIIDGYLTIWIAPDYQNLECIGKIPHKPLHLYSEQEDKDLLNLPLKMR